MKGMGEGPYSGEGFLRGWNFGNEFAPHTMLADHPRHRMTSLPQSKLESAWDWNYQLSDRRVMVSRRQFVPSIQFFAIDGQLVTTAVWPPVGMPILLPEVDRVLVGREVEGVRRFGIATWNDVLDVLESAGIKSRRPGVSVEKNPLDIRYDRTPDAIIKWFMEIPVIPSDALEFIAAYRVIDTEIVDEAAAWEPVDGSPDVIAKRGGDA